MTTRRNLAILTVALVALFGWSCSKGADASKPASARPAEQKPNDEATPVAVYAQQTARGDIERTAMAVNGALEAMRAKNTPQAIQDLEAAAEHIGKAMTSGRPDERTLVRLQVQIDEIKASIDAALNSARRGASDTASRIELIRTEIGGLKAQMGT